MNLLDITKQNDFHLIKFLDNCLIQKIMRSNSGIKNANSTKIKKILSPETKKVKCDQCNHQDVKPIESIDKDINKEFSKLGLSPMLSKNEVKCLIF